MISQLTIRRCLSQHHPLECHWQHCRHYYSAGQRLYEIRSVHTVREVKDVAQIWNTYEEYSLGESVSCTYDHTPSIAKTTSDRGGMVAVIFVPSTTNIESFLARS